MTDAEKFNRKTKRLAKSCPPNVPLQVWVCQHMEADDDGMTAEEDGPLDGEPAVKPGGRYFTTDQMRQRFPDLFRNVP